MHQKESWITNEIILSTDLNISMGKSPGAAFTNIILIPA